ncbi:DUF5681 domain-containing protein [Methylocystis parvus]|uniref:DUF5681 domain-containing protein n=1 Tax=Methylocystis parvus TaxID=134 RepID=UPI003C777F79
MKSPRPYSSPAGDYAVGYGRPPEHTRFQPGQSGNRNGRPKGSRPIGAVLQDVLQQKIPVTENGKTRRMTTLEVPPEKATRYVAIRRRSNLCSRSTSAMAKHQPPPCRSRRCSPRTGLFSRSLSARERKRRRTVALL